ncbi:PREDICTED: LOC110762039 isoform [Prunus dulcis]|uniref:PREDICTED: LOC110762039 isoform n=1 Tax=Prunus dulcis TaxID=3755 RepID=A0A5E4FI21_PRUDU|nr:PREDICTED: LOC110762039 isoform [Prunus dulcis]
MDMLKRPLGLGSIPENVISKTRAQGSSSSVPPDNITGAGVDNHAIEVRSMLYPFAKKNLDENVLHLFENTLVLAPHWFGSVPAKMATLFKLDTKASLLLPRYGAHWKRASIYDAILLSKQSINRDENLLAAALCFWNSASNTFDFRVGLMAPTLLDMAQIFGFGPHGHPVDAVGNYHRRNNQEKLAKPFTISPATINQNCSFSNYLRKFSAEKDKDQQHMLFLLY